MKRPSALIVLAAVVVAGCGSSKGKDLSPQAAALLKRDLTTVDRQFNVGGGACDDIQNATFQTIDHDLKQIPSDVDSDLRSALQDSFDRLRDLTSQDCKAPVQPTTTETAPPPTTTTEQTPTVPTPTTTQPTPEQKPKKDKGNKNGNGSGNTGGTDGGGNQSGGALAPGGN